MTKLQNHHQVNYWILLTILWSKLFIFGSKIWIGLSFQVLSLVAAALHTSIDLFSVLLSLNASQFFGRLGDREIWFHGKREAAIALLFAAFLGYADCTILSNATKQLKLFQHGTFFANVQLPLSLLLLVIMVCAVDFCIVLFERYEARILGSEVLRLNAKHMLRTSWLKVPLLLGLFGMWQGYARLDALVAIALSIMTVHSYWQVLNWQLPFLVQQVAIAPEVLHQIAHQVEGVTQCDRVCSRGMVGRQVWIEMDLVLHPDFLESVHLISDKVAELIRRQYGNVEVKIHTKSSKKKRSR
jgi:cation diffusion facilitator family transporter